MPPIEIITGVAGSGKTERCQLGLGEVTSAWVVLPSEEMCARWRQETAFPGVVARTLPDLAIALARPMLAGRELITPALRLLVLREVIREVVQPGDYFGKVSHTGGLARVMADLLRQLKQDEAGADALAAAVQSTAPGVSDPVFARKGGEIVALQRCYTRYLAERQLLDAEDVMALAIRAVREMPGRVPWPEAVVVDGFATFTPLQLSLFQAIAPHVGRFSVTLTHDPARPILFGHTDETFRRLQERFPDAQVTNMTAVNQRAAAEPLRVLEAGLFGARRSGVRVLGCSGVQGAVGEDVEPAVGALPVDLNTRTPEHLNTPLPAVCLFEAPDEMMQVEMVAREVRRLLDSGGYRPGEIGVLARSVADLGPVVRTVFARYGVPVWVHAGLRLGDNPFVAGVTTLLRVWLRDWQREDVLRLARSIYAGCNRFAVDAMERRARRLGIQRGRSRWLNAFGEGESDVVAWLGRLADCQDRMAESRTPAEYGDALSVVFTEMGWLERMRHGEPRLARADQAAWESALNVLRDLSRLSGPRPWRFQPFAETAMAGWAEGFYSLPPDEPDCVQVREVYDARGHDFRAVFVLGLVEGTFPRRPREDPCFRDDERAALAGDGGVRLPLAMAQADEERFLFYQAVTAPRERLVLCYPRTDRDGGVTLRSFFLDAVEEACASATLPVKALSLADIIADPAEAVLPRERLAYLAAAVGDGARPAEPGAPEPLRRLWEALRREQPDGVARVLAAPDARRPYHLTHPAVHARWKGRRKTYTVSELECVRACPFQHHLGYRLRLEGAADSAGPLDQGRVLHETLRRFFEEVRAAGFPAPEAARERLRALCRDLFDETPLDARPYRLRLAERAVTRYLEAFVEREQGYRDAALLEPALLEFAFGPQVEAEEGESASRGPTDPASIRQPLEVPSGEEIVRLSGKIDRIDLTPDGLYALVFDYKLGKAQTAKAMREGSSLQMPVYWLAVEQILGLTPVGGAYDAMRESKREVFARVDLTDLAFTHKGIIGRNALGKAPFEEILAQARAVIAEAAALIERLDVAPRPADASTCSFCRFQDCCRPEEAGFRLGAEPVEEAPDE